MVKCIDDNVGRLLAALREAGVLDRTMVVFTSDHGDLCGEHGRDNKGVPMETSARVPFLLRAPGLVTAGAVVREALGMVDFKPTILSLMGVPNPPGDEGRDASALLRDGKAPADWEDVAFLRIGGGARSRHDEDGEPEPARGGWLGAFTGRFKLIVAPNAEPCLFDLETDPDELANFWDSAAHRETVRRLATALHGYAQTFHEPHLAAPRVQSDLAWAMSPAESYRPPSGQPAGKEPATRKNKGKRKQDRTL